MTTQKQGISALGLQRVLDLGSYQTARAITGTPLAHTSRPESQAVGVVGDVRSTDGDGIRRVRSVELTSEQVGSGSVELAADPGGDVRVARETGPSVTVLVITALIGLAFAVVVLATVRGLGYVRGTGRYGEMDPHDVEESHAFYWRH